ncbi:protein PLASTID MOVEMENT IMPAIRED 1-RELATED 1 [Rhodamnia argentea]|uniref:Protein PLASTID MOVEMENT IMPAIRED 1-RELATED 1 n=1 Tax=Rhodamnia argentea TaxID=178133 RepID=A0A8B8QXX0_9MYRT|nr:protein PLASTID MOVEMENT IMPAIRED 1-RELATED 1 [Rhodamnia argentea]
MMLSKTEAGKKIDPDSSSGKLLQEIEAISKALYLDRNPSGSLLSAASSRSKSVGKTHLADPKSKVKHGNEDQTQKEKKSIWNWKGFKAFSHVRNRRFNCCFTLLVHSIEGLPSSFDDLSLCVHWKRRDGGLVTQPAKVFQGIAEFGENLMHTCWVYGSRSGPHHSAKYEAKHFLLYAAVHGSPELDLGKHRVDLTRLLPITLEELEEDKSSGKWTTSYRLSGEAKGASLNVSFGYTVIGDNASVHGVRQNVPDALSLNENNSKLAVRSGRGNSRNAMRRTGSLPSQSNQPSDAPSRYVEDIKDLHEVLPVSKSELASSVDTLYHKFDEEKSDFKVDYKPEFDVFTEENEPVKTASQYMSDNAKQDGENGCQVNEFSVIEQGIELSTKEQAVSKEAITKEADVFTADSHGVPGVNSNLTLPIERGTEASPRAEGTGNCEGEVVIRDCQTKADELCSKESLMKELESALSNVSDLEVAALDSPEDREDNLDITSSNKTNLKGRSLSLDDVADSVACEFLDMLGIEHSPFGLSSESEPESPRERLLRQFEREALAGGGCSLFGFDVGDEDFAEQGNDAVNVPGWGNISEDFELQSLVQAAEEEHQAANHVNKTKAKMLEDLETEALMREWGLNDKSFQSSPPSHSGGFGSPIHLAPEEFLELPPLGEGLGPYLQTKNGGFLRSMNPSLFRNAKSSGSLVMQASSPVVVPAEMGSSIMEILQGLASVGIEKLSMQANKLMPLEDITGKTMQQVAWEASPALEGVERQCLLNNSLAMEQDFTCQQTRSTEAPFNSRSSKYNQNTAGNDVGSEYVSLEDLAPLAMDKIEALSIEGLRIHSGMSDEDAPSNISAQSIGDVSTLQGKGEAISGSLGLEGTGGLQLLDIKERSDDKDEGLMSLSLSLDEWMRLDSGELDDEDQISERTSKILAAHHANSLGWIRGGSKGERRRGKGSSRKCGLLGNNFTVALMVQLRDPLRNYEPVGAPMLALIQVERVFIPPKPRMYRKVSEVKYEDEEDEMAETKKKEKIQDGTEEMKPEVEEIPQYKITEVHVAGLKTDPGKRKLWGSTNQQQSGSRWLLANGMGKSNKHPFLKSKIASSKSTAPAATTKAQPGDTLWSISSRVHGTSCKWKELATLNPHIRNPNVILPNETIRLR